MKPTYKELENEIKQLHKKITQKNLEIMDASLTSRQWIETHNIRGQMSRMEQENQRIQEELDETKNSLELAMDEIHQNTFNKLRFCDQEMLKQQIDDMKNCTNCKYWDGYYCSKMRLDSPACIQNDFICWKLKEIE